MLKKTLALYVLIAPILFLLAATTGCGDDVRTHKSVETHHESQPRMVSPGEEVVE